jgi:hypothetical protein
LNFGLLYYQGQELFVKKEMVNLIFALLKVWMPPAGCLPVSYTRKIDNIFWLC